MASCKEKALEWGVSVRTVNDLCNKGRIPGAVKVGRDWQIPEEAEKPSKKHIGKKDSVKDNQKTEKKPLPVGISDYIRAQSEYYYVDKTLLIKEFLDRKTLVTLFTRPRRFGKTLNMDMLRVFFEKSEEDTSKYFKDKAIWKYGPAYQKHQGKYPVIFLTFKDVKFESFEETLAKISELVQEEFGRHTELKDSEKLEKYEKEYFEKILKGDANKVELSASLQKLSRMLTLHYGISPIIIIDEYDTPIQEAYEKAFYDEMIGFMRNFFSGAFKDNKYLSYGFLTGILKIAQESIFSGLNNLTVDSVLDEDYESYFGFTENDVRQMLAYYEAEEKTGEVKDWYDGYFFGNQEIYNPWSVINYLAKGCIPQAYWANTGKNEILEDVLKYATDDITEKLNDLLSGERVIARIEQNVVYRSLTDDPANVYSFLLVAGYLKAPVKELQADGSWICEVQIPNREIAAVYKNIILAHLMHIGVVGKSTTNKILESMYTSDFMKLQEGIEEYMKSSISFYDTGIESFYHGLILGLVSIMDNNYRIRSNRESGDGRYDICMIPRINKYPGIIIELKSEKNLSMEALNALSGKALKQVEEKAYDNELKQEGVRDIIKLGIAFSGKNVRIQTAQSSKQ